MIYRGVRFGKKGRSWGDVGEGGDEIPKYEVSVRILTKSAGAQWGFPIRQVLFALVCPQWLNPSSDLDTQFKQTTTTVLSSSTRPNGHCSHHRKTQETLLGRPHHRSRSWRRCRVRLLVRVFLTPVFHRVRAYLPNAL